MLLCTKTFNDWKEERNTNINSLFHLCVGILKGIFSCPERLLMVHTSEKHQTHSCRKCLVADSSSAETLQVTLKKLILHITLQWHRYTDSPAILGNTNKEQVNCGCVEGTVSSERQLGLMEELVPAGCRNTGEMER